MAQLFIGRAPDNTGLSTHVCQAPQTEELLRILVTAGAPVPSVPSGPLLGSLSCQRLPRDTSTSQSEARRDSGGLTAALQTSGLHAQRGIHVTVAPARSFIEHGVSEIFRGCWSVECGKTEPNFSTPPGLFLPPFCHVIRNLRSHLSSQIMPENSLSATILSLSLSLSVSLRRACTHTHTFPVFFLLPQRAKQFFPRGWL